MVKKMSPRLSEPAARGSQDEGSRNLGHTFLTLPVCGQRQTTTLKEGSRRSLSGMIWHGGADDENNDDDHGGKLQTVEAIRQVTICEGRAILRNSDRPPHKWRRDVHFRPCPSFLPSLPVDRALRPPIFDSLNETKIVLSRHETADSLISFSGYLSLFSLLCPAVKNPRSAIDIRNRPRIPIPDEDPYSIAGSGSSGGSSGNGNRERSRDKPPKLPPRENIYGTAGHPKAWTPAAARQAQVRDNR